MNKDLFEPVFDLRQESHLKLDVAMFSQRRRTRMVSGKKPDYRVRPRLEALEYRLTPAEYTWGEA